MQQCIVDCINLSRVPLRVVLLGIRLIMGIDSVLQIVVVEPNRCYSCIVLIKVRCRQLSWLQPGAICLVKVSRVELRPVRSRGSPVLSQLAVTLLKQVRCRVVGL